MRPLVLIGGGGHCRVVLDAVRAGGDHEAVAVIDVPERAGGEFEGVPVEGREVLPELKASGVVDAFVSVGSVGDAAKRRELAEEAHAAGFRLAVVVHPSAVVSPSAVLGEGTFVGPRVVVNAGSVLGKCCIVNSGAIIEHDCRIGDFAHVAPGAVVNGGCEVGAGTHVGSGAVVRQGVRVGSEALVGAGSVVVTDIADGARGYGVPWREARDG